MRVRASLTILSLLFAVSSFAQSGITGQNYRQYVAGASSPIAGPSLLPIANILCGQTPPNPQLAHTIVWADPNNAAMVCIYTDPGTGVLLATVKSYGNMEGTLTNLAGTLESPESARAPFAKLPPAPVALKIVP
jgi:hypothetical protein